MTLALQDLTKSFGPKQVLRGVSLEARGGKALGLLGRNGAGKTTAIRIVMDVFPPDRGDVLLDGRPFDRNAVRVGYLPEERGLYPRKKILDQLIYFAALRDVPRNEARAAAIRLLERLGASEYLHARLDTLSKGNQQKIQLAAALITDPDVVVLDEPFSGLDPVNASLLKEAVSDLIRAGKVVFFSSHQMNYIEEFCQEIAVLRDGKLAVSGTIRDIKRSFDRRRILLHTPEPETVARFARESCQAWVETLEDSGGVLTAVLREAGMLGALLRALTAAVLPLEGFVVAEPSLTDIFVRYTEGEV